MRRSHLKIGGEHETNITTKLIELAVQCPGLNLGELADTFGTTPEAVSECLKAHSLGSFGQRVWKLPRFRRGCLNEWAAQSLYPGAPGRICHVDSSLLGIRIDASGFVRTVQIGVIVDGLTNYVTTCVMHDDDGLGWIVNKALRAGDIWQVYVFDSRADALPGRHRVEKIGREHVTAVLGTIWHNGRAERIHAYIHRFLMKWPASDYVNDEVIEKRLRKFEQLHNDVLSKSRRGPTPSVMQNERRQWTKDEIMALAAQRGRKVVGAQEYRSDLHPGDGWAWVLDMEPTHRGIRSLMSFAEDRAPGFYWAG